MNNYYQNRLREAPVNACVVVLSLILAGIIVIIGAFR